MVYFFLFVLEGTIYTCVELLYRGHTHWTMFIVGGICGIVCGLLNEYKFNWNESFLKQCITGAALITLIEFISGMILNVWLKLGIWDYSNLPLNICGQVSLIFTCAWTVLAGIAIVFDDWIRYWYYKVFGGKVREKPHYKLF